MMNYKTGSTGLNSWIRKQLERLETPEQTKQREFREKANYVIRKNEFEKLKYDLGLWENFLDDDEKEEMIAFIKEAIGDTQTDNNAVTSTEVEFNELVGDKIIKVQLNLDNIEFKHKPNKKETGAIQKRIGSLKTEITVEELANAIGQGRSFKAAALNGNKNADWESQQVFCIDVDNDEKSVAKYGMLTIEEAYNRFNLRGISPAFIYESFSSTTEQPKFRLVFIAPTPVTDVRIRNAIQMALMNIMPEGDVACKDLSRLFHGTNKACEYIDYAATVNPYELIQAMVGYIKEVNRNPNDSKIIKNYCQSAGLNMINGLPNVQLLENSKNGINTLNSIIYNIESNENIPKKLLFDFNIEKENSYKITVACEGKKKFNKVDIESTKVKYEEVQHFDFDQLEVKCELWSDFINGTRWCHHNEVFGIASNMWRVRGAETRMIAAINENNDYEDKYNKINTIKSCGSYGYLPNRCANFCPYYTDCSNIGLNMLQSLDNKRASIRQVEDIQEISVDAAAMMLSEVVMEAYNTEDNKVTVVKGGTGLGKTTILKSLPNFNGLCISYPNHRLGTDIVERLNLENAVHVKELLLEDADALKEFRRLQCIGAYKQARKYLEDYMNKLLVTATMGSPERTEAYKVINTINDYIEALDKCRTTTGTVFCTHKRMLDLNNTNINTYIIDEDIILSSLVKTINLKVTQLDTLIELASRYKTEITKGQLVTIKEKVIEAIEKPGQAFEMPAFFIKDKEVNSIIETNKNNLDLDLKELLRTRIVTANANREVLGMAVGELPNKKCIILSATANETVYKSLLADREVEFIDLGNIETEGDLILHYTGFSRTALNENFDKSVDKIREEAPNIDNIITFAKYEDKFKKAGFNPIAHFGACSGLDAYKGQDLIVAGTPHIDERVYFLLAAAIKEDIVIEQGIDYTNVRRNGFEFYFNTYNHGSVTKTDNLLQEIQFYLIESELIQAVGRARILRTDATVHLFSNCPLLGCKLYE